MFYIKILKMKEGKIMFANLEEIQRRVTNIQNELKDISADNEKAPEGELFCAKNGSNYKWYLKRECEYEYIRKSESELAQNLAVKKYNNMRQKDLAAELKACKVYIRRSEREGGNADKLLEHDEYRKLIGTGRNSVKKELKIWRKEEYEKNNNHSDKLIVRGTQGKFLRSKSEAIIDKILYNSGIPFHYEEKLVLKNAILYPDFTIRHPRTGAFYYWEHFGMMDSQDYIGNACSKLRIYCENGIIPSVNLILTFETREHPLGTDEVEWLVRRYFM